MESPLVLIVEDETKLAEVLSEYLLQAGFRTERLERGDRVVPFVESQSPDLILLDLMLPGRDGMDVCRDVRRFSSVPIIMTSSARTTTCANPTAPGRSWHGSRRSCGESIQGLRTMATTARCGSTWRPSRPGAMTGAWT